MISSPWRPGIALATAVLEFCKVLDLKVKVLAKLGLGMCQGGVWTGSYKGFAGFGKGVPHILLIRGEFGRGDMLDQKVQNLARA